MVLEPSLEHVAAGGIPAALRFLKQEESLFVTPGDLLRHCTNVVDVGVIG